MRYNAGSNPLLRHRVVRWGSKRYKKPCKISSLRGFFLFVFFPDCSRVSGKNRGVYMDMCSHPKNPCPLSCQERDMSWQKSSNLYHSCRWKTPDHRKRFIGFLMEAACIYRSHLKDRNAGEWNSGRSTERKTGFFSVNIRMFHWNRFVRNRIKRANWKRQELMRQKTGNFMAWMDQSAKIEPDVASRDSLL